MNEKNKEIIEVRKKYLEQIEKFDSKVYFTLLSFSISMIILNIKFPNFLGIANLLLYFGGALFVITILLLELVLDFRRKKLFNDLIREIKKGEIGSIK